MSLRFLTFTFWNYYVLKLLGLETITCSDATLSDINVVLCYVLSQYPRRYIGNVSEKKIEKKLLKNMNGVLYIHLPSVSVCILKGKRQKIALQQKAS